MTNTSTTVNEAKPTARVPFGKTSNPTNLVFPQDRTGFTTLVRKEGARAVGRIGGDPERLAVFLATLRVLGDHAKAKLEAQKDARAALVAKDALTAHEAALRAAHDEADEITRLEKLVAATTAEIQSRIAG